MKKSMLLIATLLILLGSFIIYLNQTSRNSSFIFVQMLISKNFGKEIILERNLTIALGASALDALKTVAEVETSYGGGFVTSINGIKSAYPEEPYDWFFYVNGFLAKEGAATYTLFNNDFIQWDYHYWGDKYFQTATLACYPNGFINGYKGKVKPTIIVFQKEFSKEAEELKQQLSQLNVNVKSLPIDELSENEKANFNIIILAKLDAEPLVELNEIHEKIGLRIYFDKRAVFEASIEGYKQYLSVGFIQATQNIWNPNGNMACENIILIISGTDAELIKKAANLMLNFQYCKHFFSLIVTSQEILSAPTEA